MSEPSVPTMIRSNKDSPSFAPDCAGIVSAGPPMPRSWRYMMAVLIVCLIASMVIAVIKLV